MIAAAKTPEQVAKMFGCTVEQARAQIAANAKQMREMASKAEKSGKFRGYTASQLMERAAAFEMVLA